RGTFLVAGSTGHRRRRGKGQAGAQDRGRADPRHRSALMRPSEPAPAKLNLALHVRGRLDDGRHSLETLFAFCVDGDRLEAEVADGIALEIAGPFASQLPGPDNLVLQAAEALRKASG